MTDDVEVEERVTAASTQASIIGHELRYRLAAGYIDSYDVVLDAACGTGYGVGVVNRQCSWVGVDIADCVEPVWKAYGRWLQYDLMSWRPDFGFDVALSFETIEHVADPEFLIASLCQARRLVICSVPVVPTTHFNKWHLHDFEAHDLPDMFDGYGWELQQYLFQTREVSGIYVFAKP